MKSIFLTCFQCLQLMSFIGHKHCELWHMSQLLLAVVAGVRDSFINIPTKTQLTHTLKRRSLDARKALWHTSLSALISSLNPLRCKAARRNLKHRVLGNCAVMTTLQQGYTGENEFYLLLKRARWESGVREKPAVPSSTRPTTQRLFHS